MFEFWLRSSELVSTEELRCLVVVVVVVSVCAAQPAKQQSKRIPQYFVIVFITEAYPERSSSRKVSDVGARQSPHAGQTAALAKDGHLRLPSYFSGIGCPGVSCCQKIFTIHQRFPSWNNWKLLIPRMNGSASSGEWRDS